MKTLKKIILDDSRTTIRDVADNVVILFGSCQAIFTDVLGMKRLFVSNPKIVPKCVNFEQKKHRMDIDQEMLATFNDDPDCSKRS